jgi:WD40 repeat protein
LAAHEKGRQLVALAVSPSGSLLASADDYGEIVLWDADAWKSLATLPTQGAVTSLAFAPDGATLIAALKNGQLARVSGLAAKNTLQREIVATARQPEHSSYQAEITSLAYDPHGALLATGGADHRVLLWDAKSFQQLHAFEASAPVLCVAFSADGRHLAAGTEQSNALHVWDVLARQTRATIKGHSKNVRSVAFVGDAEHLWSASEDGQLKAWELSRCRPFETVSVPISIQTTVAFGSDGRTLLIHGEDGAVHQWPFAGQSPPAPWNKDEKATELAFGPDGAFLATWSPAQKLRLWDLADNNLRGEWAVPDKPRLNWPYPGQLLAVARGGGTIAWTQQRGDATPIINVLHVANGKRMIVDLGQQPSLPPIVTSVVLSADGKRMASQHVYETVLWDLSGAQPALGPVLPYLGPETCLAFSPDGEDLAIGSWNNDIRIVAAKTGQLKQRLRGHAGAIYSVAFAQDGTMLVSGSADGTVRLWDAKTGDLHSTFTGHDGPVIAVAISPDRTAVASCSLDQTVRVWRAATPADVSQKNQEEGQSFRRHGEIQMLRGNWEAAGAEWARALDLLPPGTPVWHDTAYRLAFVLAYTGETEKYQALCRRTVRDFQHTTNVQIAERTSTMCLFAGSVQDHELREQAGRFADFALANIDGAIARKQISEWMLAFVQHAKGIAEYRRGNYALALDWFAKSVPGMSKAGNADWVVWCQATDLFFSAMAAHQLGTIEDTRKALAEARRLISTFPRADNTDWLMMDLVRREAEALIEGKKLGYHADRP